MLVRKLFPLLKISTTFMQLTGFTYATALDLNMGYYTIRTDAKASKMCTIIFHGVSTLTRDYLWELVEHQTSSKDVCLT
jgi:hypothetical protein